MNCLTYLLQLWDQGHRFTIFYDGNHCCGVSDKKLFDLNSTFKKDMMDGNAGMYLPLENCHSKEVTKRIFNLGYKHSKILDEYYRA